MGMDETKQVKEETTIFQGWALFHDGRQISKAHEHVSCVWVEALEAGAIWKDWAGEFLMAGYTIEQVKE